MVDHCGSLGEIVLRGFQRGLELSGEELPYVFIYTLMDTDYMSNTHLRESHSVRPKRAKEKQRRW